MVGGVSLRQTLELQFRPHASCCKGYIDLVKIVDFELFWDHCVILGFTKLFWEAESYFGIQKVILVIA